MADTTNLSIRIDRGLKDEADNLFNDMGMNLTTAITIFIKQAVRQKKIPFEIALDSNSNENGISLIEVMAASERIWDNAVRTGTADMSMDDIDAEIKASRKERKARRVVL
jgi:DNA-damage-inducible protein J